MSLDTQVTAGASGTVEMLSAGGAPSAARGTHLVAAVRAADEGFLWRWENQVTAALSLGIAQVVTVPLDTADLPVGAVVGGWPIAEPCCVGAPAPTSDNLLREDGWHCDRCGDTLVPQRWAAMSLGRDPAGAWMLPDPAVFAAHADAALREIHAARGIAAERSASQLAAAAERGEARRCSVRFAVPRRHGDDAPTPWQPTALVGADLDDDGHALVLFGYWGPKTDRPAGGSGGLKIGFHDVGARVTMRPAQLLDLLGGDRLAAEVAQRGLSADGLSSAWLRAAGAAPGWLTTPAVMDEIAAAAHERTAQARVAERGRGGLGL